MSETERFLRLARAGDGKAFEALVNDQGGRLYGIALRVTGDPSLAEDVLQETFLRLVEGRAPCREEARAEAWLGRVTTRLAIDVVRRRAARRRREERHAALEASAPRRPEELASLAEETELLTGSFAALPIETRAAVWLHVVEGQGMREVAEVLGSSRSTVQRRISSGLASLRASLARSGLALVPGLSVEEGLRGLPAPEPPPETLARIARLSPRVPPALPREPMPPAADRQNGGPARQPPWRAPGVGWALAGVAAAAAVVISVAVRQGSRPPAAPQAVRNAPAAVPLSSPPAPTRESEVAAADRGPGLISGRVIDPEGQPVAGAAVRAHADLAAEEVQSLLDTWDFLALVDQTLAGVPVLAETTSAADGGFTLPFAGPGEPRVIHASAPAPGSALAGAIHVAAGTKQEGLEIRLVPAAIVSGVVRDAAGAPLPRARVALVPDPSLPFDRDVTAYDFQALLDRFLPLSAEADAAGRFELPPLPLGPKQLFRVLAAHPGHAAGHALVKLPAGEVELRLEPARPVPGQVIVSRPGVAASEARILVLGSVSPAEAPAKARQGWFATAVAGDQGQFSFEGADGAPFILLAKIPGQPGTRVIEGRIDAGDFPLRVVFEAGGMIHGTVRQARGGGPAAGVRLVYRGLEGAYAGTETRTDEEGHYALSGVPLDSELDLIVALPGFMPRLPLSAPPSAASPSVRHDIELVETAVLSGKVVDGAGEGIGRALVEVIAVADAKREGRSLRWRREILGQAGTLTGAGGEFRFADVVPASQVFLWAYQAGIGEHVEGPIQLVPGRPAADLTLTLEPAGLEVTAVDSSGKPLERLNVQLVIEAIWHVMPPGYHLEEWYSALTSFDLSRHEREGNTLPGQREGVTGVDGRCGWKDLMPAPYQILFHVKSLSGRGEVPIWEEDHWYWVGTTDRLPPGELTSFQVAFDLTRTLSGTVVSAGGAALPEMRVQAFYRGEFPPLRRAYGYSVTHTRADGTFTLERVGRGPYWIQIKDRDSVAVDVKGIPDGADDLRLVYDPPARK